MPCHFQGSIVSGEPRQLSGYSLHWHVSWVGNHGGRIGKQGNNQCADETGPYTLNCVQVSPLRLGIFSKTSPNTMPTGQCGEGREAIGIR